MANSIVAYDRPTDVDVVMSIERPKPTVGLGNLLIINQLSSTPAQSGSGNTSTPADQAEVPSDKLSADDILDGILLRKTDAATGAVYREYASLDAVKVDYSDNDDVMAKAEAYFAQEYHSDRVAILDIPSGKELDALGAFWFFNWTFAVRAKSDDQQSELTLLSNIFEANKDHFLVIQTNDVSALVPLQGQNYTIGLKHDTSEAMDAAFVGEIATLPVGSVTWKFKTLTGITPEELTAPEVVGINKVNAIAYKTSFGKDQTTEGKALSGEYIDTLHGILWVKSNMESDFEKMLQDNDKIPYSQVGINMITGVATQVLNRAFEQGIIQADANGKADFSISASPREQQSAQDLSNRHYGGLSFTYHASNAIHTLTIYGTIDSDTILQ